MSSNVFVTFRAFNVVPQSAEVFLNGSKIGDMDVNSRSFSFVPQDTGVAISGKNRLTVTAIDGGSNFSHNIDFNIQ